MSKGVSLRLYRIHLHSLEVLKLEFDLPPFIDVWDRTKGKALTRALKIMGLKRFPKKWKTIKVEKLVTKN